MTDREREAAVRALATEYAGDSHVPVASAEAFLEWLDGCQRETKAALAAYLAASQPPSGEGLRTTCPKCGKADIYDSWDPTDRPEGRLERRCRNCRYSWTEPPLDAAPSRPSPEPRLREALALHPVTPEETT